MIKVLVADESPIVCRVLTSYLQAADDIDVVGAASDGASCLAQLHKLRPDVITLGLEMTPMDGLETLAQIMHNMPTPVVMITGASRRAARLSIEALNAGAVDFVLKYSPSAHMTPDGLRQEIVAKVRAAAQVKVVRSVRSRLEAETADMPISEPAQFESEAFDFEEQLPGGVVVIGASTGGPVAVRELLDQLPSNFGAAVLIVQHMPATFTGVLAAQLNHQVPMTVREAQEGDCLQAGQALVVPGDYHLLVQPDASVILNQAPKIMGHRPSIDVTMQSVAHVIGRHSTGVVLTGMGEDGTLGLVAIQSKGGKTYAQDSSSAVVDGMPQQARQRGVVDIVGTPAEIGRKLRLEIGDWRLAAGEPALISNF